jgi:predicted house-cleaning noncanonical NTP pyrophosphatase (MazG superfamily)
MKEKLIRDKVAEVVFSQRGELLDIRVAGDDEFLNFLKQKIVEGAYEVLNAETNEQLIEELADVMETVKAIAMNKNIVDEMFKKIDTKYKEYGAFDRKIILKIKEN